MTTVCAMYSFVLLADVCEGVGAEGGESVNALSRDRADGVRSLFLEELELKFATGGLHFPLFVRLGSIAMLSAVCQSLNHPAQIPLMNKMKLHK